MNRNLEIGLMVLAATMGVSTTHAQAALTANSMRMPLPAPSSECYKALSAANSSLAQADSEVSSLTSQVSSLQSQANSCQTSLTTADNALTQCQKGTEPVPSTPYDYDCALMSGLAGAANVCNVSSGQMYGGATYVDSASAYFWAFNWSLQNLSSTLGSSNPQTAIAQEAVQTAQSMVNSGITNGVTANGFSGAVDFTTTCASIKRILQSAAASVCSKSARGY